ncbi:hypothetical protein F2S74_05260 [Pseudomonas syringae pv. actinidiae]|uniref:hypothetical protein n=2 Tax=Pseudomonas syringae TaxID=317 RepID=UPI0017F567B7|nr:hypothetical protein [Pseudomonas syringae]NVL42307.1 hypothetical protein [Pseudomonas syringae pv. actinidiae]NVL47208.1 hypothetical protein [Pseudomonas syringae pv. actinidiae]NYS40743.1 hypothetical protein [Pseudomonas syringae pv. actinidiae]
MGVQIRGTKLRRLICIFQNQQSKAREIHKWNIARSVPKPRALGRQGLGLFPGYAVMLIWQQPVDRLLAGQQLSRISCFSTIFWQFSLLACRFFS